MKHHIMMIKIILVIEGLPFGKSFFTWPRIRKQAPVERRRRGGLVLKYVRRIVCGILITLTANIPFLQVRDTGVLYIVLCLLCYLGIHVMPAPGGLKFR